MILLKHNISLSLKAQNIKIILYVNDLISLFRPRLLPPRRRADDTRLDLRRFQAAALCILTLDTAVCPLVLDKIICKLEIIRLIYKLYILHAAERPVFYQKIGTKSRISEQMMMDRTALRHLSLTHVSKLSADPAKLGDELSKYRMSIINAVRSELKPVSQRDPVRLTGQKILDDLIYTIIIRSSPIYLRLLFGCLADIHTAGSLPPKAQ